MPLWFWAWVIVAAAIGVVSALTRDRFSAPWAAGAAVAAGLVALDAAPGWEWIAFIAVSSVLFVAINRVRYRGRHARGRTPGRGDAPAGRDGRG